VAELADALRSGRSELRAHVGSTPTFGTSCPDKGLFVLDTGWNVSCSLQGVGDSGMMIQAMSPSSQERRRGTTLLIVVLVAAGILILGDLNSRMVDARRLERDAEALQTEVAAEATRNADLKTQVAGATGEAQVREWAHSQAGMVQEGERLVVPLAEEGQYSAVTPTPTPALGEPSNWEVWWALLFGG
jgi:cell division protein FtsB